jgi:hypothetical protein
MGDVNRKMGEKTDGGVNEMVKNRRINMKNIASRPKNRLPSVGKHPESTAGHKQHMVTMGT